MPSKLVFPTVELESFGRDREGGTAKFKSTLSGDVMSAMGWVEMPECATGADLEGELAVRTFELTPKDEGLKRHRTEIEVHKVGKFKTVRLELEGKKGKGHRTELRFTVWFADTTGARKLEEYILTAGKSKLVLSYEPAAKQDELPGIDPELDTGCIACNSGIPLQAGGKKHESGAKCTARAVQEPLEAVQ